MKKRKEKEINDPIIDLYSLEDGPIKLYSIITEPDNSSPKIKAESMAICNKILNSPNSETERFLVINPREMTDIREAIIDPKR